MKFSLLFLSFALILTGRVIRSKPAGASQGPTKVVLTGTVYDTNHAVILSSEVVARSFEGKEYSGNDQ